MERSVLGESWLRGFLKVIMKRTKLHVQHASTGLALENCEFRDSRLETRGCRVLEWGQTPSGKPESRDKRQVLGREGGLTLM